MGTREQGNGLTARHADRLKGETQRVIGDAVEEATKPLLARLQRVAALVKDFSPTEEQRPCSSSDGGTHHMGCQCHEAAWAARTLKAEETLGAAHRIAAELLNTDPSLDDQKCKLLADLCDTLGVLDCDGSCEGHHAGASS